MLARIIPLKRLPSGMHIFDYLIPETLLPSLRPGQIVTIPLRKTIIPGLVFSIQKRPDHHTNNLKPLQEIISYTPLISERQLDLLMFFAKFYGVAAGVIARYALPPLKLRKISTLTLKSPVKPERSPHTLSPILYHHYENREARQEFYSTLLDKHSVILIILPRIHDIDDTVALITPLTDRPIITYSSDLTDKSRYDAWCSLVSPTPRIIIGTRGSVLLPIDDLDLIIIDHEADPEHKHRDTAPRFHTKDIAKMKHLTMGVSVIHAGNMPSIESYALHTREVELPHSPSLFSPRPFTLVDMAEEYRARRFHVLSDTAKQAIRDASGDVLILVSRRGYSRSLNCSSCGYVYLCTLCQGAMVYHKDRDKLLCHYCHRALPVSYTCPECHGSVMEFSGYGSAFIAEGITEMLHDRDIAVLRVDGDTGLKYPDHDKQTIIVGTEMALRAIDWNRTSLIIYLDPDKVLQTPEVSADESLWTLLFHIAERASPTCQIMLQTFSRKHLLYRSLATPDEFYRESLRSRQTLSFPPYCYLVRYMYGASSATDAKQEAEKMYLHLQDVFISEQIAASIAPPLSTHPAYGRQKYWYVIIVKFAPDTKLNIIAKLNAYFGPGWKIDPRPQTLQML